jgi:hypothetical protein
MTYLSALKYAAPFLAGVLLTLLWHGFVMRGVQNDQLTTQVVQAEQKIVYIDREVKSNDDNSAQYLAELDKARKESDSLRAGLAAGSVAIRVCRADATTAIVRADSAGALAEATAADNAQLERLVVSLLEHAERNDAWMKSAHEFMNRER